MDGREWSRSTGCNSSGRCSQTPSPSRVMRRGSSVSPSRTRARAEPDDPRRIASALRSWNRRQGLTLATRIARSSTSPWFRSPRTSRSSLRAISSTDRPTFLANTSASHSCPDSPPARSASVRPSVNRTSVSPGRRSTEVSVSSMSVNTPRSVPGVPANSTAPLARRMAGRAHQRRRLGSLAAHVPYHQRPSAVLGVEGVVEVTAHVDPLAGRLIPGRELDPRDLGERAGKQAFLERPRDVIAFPIEPRIVEGQGGSGGEILSQQQVALAVGPPGFGEDEGDRAQRAPACPKRQEHDRAQLKLSDDLERLLVQAPLQECRVDRRIQLRLPGPDHAGEAGGRRYVDGECAAKLPGPYHLRGISVGDRQQFQ